MSEGKNCSFLPVMFYFFFLFFLSLKKKNNKKNRYWRYSEEMRSMDPGYPKPITIWKGIPESPQGAFVHKENGMQTHLCFNNLLVY